MTQHKVLWKDDGDHVIVTGLPDADLKKWFDAGYAERPEKSLPPAADEPPAEDGEDDGEGEGDGEPSEVEAPLVAGRGRRPRVAKE